MICSHVLEHVDDPERAAAELSRVGRRGYVETPSATLEHVAGFPFHKWLVSLSDGVLVFNAKSARLEDPELRDWFGRMLDELGISERFWFSRRRIGAYTELHWSGHIEVDVRGEPPSDAFVAASPQTADVNDRAVPERSRGSRLIDAWGRGLRRQSEVGPTEFLRLLRCPACANLLRHSGTQSLQCTSCGRGYLIDARGRPHLVVDPA